MVGAWELGDVRAQVHGPAAEIEKLKGPLAPLGCQFYVAEWGFRPSKPQAEDSVCHLYPYFTLKDPIAFKRIWKEAYAATQANAEAEKSHMCEPARRGVRCPGFGEDAHVH